MHSKCIEWKEKETYGEVKIKKRNLSYIYKPFHLQFWTNELFFLSVLISSNWAKSGKLVGKFLKTCNVLPLNLKLKVIILKKKALYRLILQMRRLDYTTFHSICYFTLQRVPALRGLEDLEKIVLHEFRLSWNSNILN